MISHRKGRELALQSLYALEFGQPDISAVKKTVVKKLGINQDEIEYGTEIITKVTKYSEEIDTYITKSATNWPLNRLAVIDKILMRCSVVEMLYIENIPVKVSITEAVQMAKKYSTEESAVFINGVLDAIARENSLSV